MREGNSSKSNDRLMVGEVHVVEILGRGASIMKNNTASSRRRREASYCCHSRTSSSSLPSPAQRVRRRTRRRSERRMKPSHYSFLSMALLLSLATTHVFIRAASQKYHEQYYPLRSMDAVGVQQRRRQQQQRSRRSLQVVGSRANHGQEYTNNSDDEVATRNKRVMVDKFDVVLETTPFALNQRDINSLHGTMEQVITDYITQQPDLPLGVTVDYVLLGDIRTDSASFSQTILSVARGIVHFDVGAQEVQGNGNAAVPSQALVNQWIKEAIDTRYAEALEVTDYYYIQSATSPREGDDAEDTTTPQEDETAPVLRVDKIVQDEGPVSNSNSSTHWVGESTGLIAAIVAAAALVVAVTLFAVVRRRSHSSRVHYIEQINSSASCSGVGGGEQQPRQQQQQQQQEDKEPVFNTSSVDPTAGMITPPCGLSPIKVSSLLSHHQDECNKSLAGSESDFTVNTEAGDCATLKSLSHHANSEDTKKMVATESFQRERPVCLRKDMLTSAWGWRGSGNNGSGTTNNADTLCATRIQNESVLEPSHFSASEERTRLSRPNESPNSPDDNNSNNSSKEGSLIFEQANEENQGVVTLMAPPSRQPANQQRGTGSPPKAHKAEYA